ncbi:MAG: tetratricopeptide repeat protein [Muribaculum sp.]|nr:tetratricopeptide repeat protein [Muribaculum sp.]
MKRLLYILILLALASSSGAVAADFSTRRERNYIREGNDLYKQKHYADAEVAYRKAVEENPMSETALYNLALSLIRQAGTSDPNAENSPMQEAQSILNSLAESAQKLEIAEKAMYNLGNMAFNQEQYQQAIDAYKGALRRNPDNDKTRENLRLAQLKLQQQQQNQDQNKDQNKDQNQDQQNQDQQQQNQDQNKDQNKDQNQDQQQQNQDKKDQQQQQQQKQNMSDENAAKILKTMENEENATRRKVQEMQKKKGQGGQRTTGPQW